jgi:hypothetical protein
MDAPRLDEADRLLKALDRLDDRVRRWSPARWSTTVGPGSVTRAQIAYELGTVLAVLAREAGNGAPDRTPPRPEPYALADQLVVLGREVLNAPGAARVAERARAAVESAYAALG